MKNKVFKSVLTGAAVLTLAILVSSCKKNDVDSSGSANLKVVNASSTSTPQGFYLASKAVIQGGLAFGNSSDYIVANSGSNLVAEFRNEGTGSAYASGNFDFDNGKYYTVFLAGDGQSARIKVFGDDRSAPESGKAKVRFVHLGDAAANNIDIKKGSGESLVVNLAHDNASNYISVDPGILSLQLFETGQTTSLGDFNLTAFAEGKIYTVYITGSTANDISVHQISHN